MLNRQKSERGRNSRAKPLADLVVDVLRRLRGELAIDPKDFVQLVLEPGTRRRSAKAVIVVGERLPDAARIRLDWCGRRIQSRNTERL